MSETSDSVGYKDTPDKLMIIKTLPTLYNLLDLNTVEEIKSRLESFIYSYLDWDDVILNEILQSEIPNK